MQPLQPTRNVECLLISSIQKDFFPDATGHYKLGICMLQKNTFFIKERSKQDRCLKSDVLNLTAKLTQRTTYKYIWLINSFTKA